MPKKIIIPKKPCKICGTTDYWRTTGRCKSCSLLEKGKRAKERHINQPPAYGTDKVEDTKAQAFKKREAEIMERTDYS